MTISACVYPGLFSVFIPMHLALKKVCEIDHRIEKMLLSSLKEFCIMQMEDKMHGIDCGSWEVDLHVGDGPLRKTWSDWCESLYKTHTQVCTRWGDKVTCACVQPHKHTYNTYCRVLKPHAFIVRDTHFSLFTCYTFLMLTNKG